MLSDLLVLREFVVLREFAISSCAGAMGGLVGGINAATNNSIRLVRIYRSKIDTAGQRDIKLDLGFIGDLLVGAAAGIAVVFFINIGVTNSSPEVDYVRLVPISLMAGVVSKRALAGMSEVVIGKLVSDTQQIREEQIRLQDQVRKLDHVNELIQEGERHLKEGEDEKHDRTTRIGKYESARDLFLQATEVDHRHSVAYVCLGKALKRLSGETTDKTEQINLRRAAIDAACEAIKLNPAYDRAYYNRACYKALNGQPVSEVLNDLEKAIHLFPLNRLYAKADGDFEAVRRDVGFQCLVDETEHVVASSAG